MPPVMYTTVDAVKSEMGIEDDAHDALIRRKIRSYSHMFDTIIGRCLAYDDAFTEYVAQPAGRRRLVVSSTPVHDVTEINFEGDVVDVSDYFIEDKDTGFIAKKYGTWGDTAASPANIRRRPRQQPLARYTVTYEKGYITPQQDLDDPQLERDLPYDVEDAILAAVVSGVNQAGVDSAVASLSVGDGSTTFVAQNDATPRQVPALFTEVAHRYKRVSVL